MGSGLPGMMFKLVVSDLNRMADFYRNILLLTEKLRFDSVMNHRPMSEVMFEYADGSIAPLAVIKYLDGGTPSHDQAVPVFFTDDVKAMLDRIDRHGGRVNEDREDRANDARIVFWYDPEGNVVETVQMNAGLSGKATRQAAETGGSAGD